MKSVDVFFWIVFVGIPNFAFYAALVALTTLAIRKTSPRRPALPRALAATAAVALLITVPGNVVTAWHAAALDDADVRQAKAIPLSGEILIDRVLAEVPSADRASAETPDYPSAEARAMMDDHHLTTGCGNICRALLATPGVAAVTVNKTGERDSSAPGPGAVRYTVAAPGQCGSEPDIGVEDFIHEGLFDPPEVGCVAPGPPVRRADFVLREAHVEAREGIDTRRSIQTRLAARPTGYYRMEITDGGGRPLFRATRPFVEAPMLPLIAADWLFGEQPLVLGLPLPFSIPWLAGPGSPAVGVDRMLIERTTIRRPQLASPRAAGSVPSPLTAAE